MIAARIIVSEDDRKHVESFVHAIQDKDIFAYKVSDNSFIAVTEGLYSWRHVEARLVTVFDEINVIRLK